MILKQGKRAMICPAVFIAVMMLPRATVRATPKAPPLARLTLGLVSNAVWRGHDLHAGRAEQKNRAFGSHTGEWALQPNIVIRPARGDFKLSIFASLAMWGRRDQDVDRVLQTGPSRCDLLASGASAQEGGAPPGYYREANGLARMDAAYITVSYGPVTRPGLFEVGVTSTTNLDQRRRAENPAEELLLKFSPAAMRQLSFSARVNLSNSDRYYLIRFDRERSLGDSRFKLQYGLGAGYTVSDLRGFQDIRGYLALRRGRVSAGLHFTHRPALAFFDEDTANSADIAYWLRGESSRGDGLVIHRGRVHGPVNVALNNAVTAAVRAAGCGSCEFRPRSKLPRVLWWFRAAYTHEIE